MYDIYLLILFKIFTLLKISFDYVVWLIIQVLPDSDPFSNSPHDSRYSSSDSSFSDSSSSQTTTNLHHCFPNVLEPSTTGLSSIMESIEYMDALLSIIGTYILILPLTVIIVSLLIQSTSLNIIACLFSIIMSISRGTLLEYTNLDSKREVFINEYKTAMMNKLAYSQIKEIKGYILGECNTTTTLLMAESKTNDK